jgi:hypothetical protein
MSKKITSKNLHYDSSLPPFLARLRGQAVSGPDDGPDPILAGRRRAAKPRSGSAEAEDAPLVVDEGGNVVDGVSVGVDGAVRQIETTPKDDEGGEKVEEERAKPNDVDGKNTGDKGTGIWAGKKRKVGKVIGGLDEDADDQEKTGREKHAKEKTKVSSKVDVGEKSSSSKGKKKAKKIKLSFGDDEEP